MNPIIEQKIIAARSEVQRDSMPPERKDALQSMLDHAHSVANGNPDKIGAIAEAMSYIIIHIVRAETREHDRTCKAIADHSTECKANRVPKTAREFVLSVAAQYPLLAVLFIGVAIERGWLAKIAGLL
jgi:hypothetical protein